LISALLLAVTLALPSPIISRGSSRSRSIGSTPEARFLYNRGDCRFFLDTAVVGEWKELLPLGIFHGITTNPTLLKRADLACTIPQCEELAKLAFDLGAREFMLQAWGDCAATMVENGVALASSDRARIVIKVPVTIAGTTAAAALITRGISVCLTACYAQQQALIAGSVGAEYVAPYLGRMDDAGKDGFLECTQMQAITDGIGSETRILVASIRRVDQLSSLAAAGMDTFTFSPTIARGLFDVPLTSRAAAEFKQAADGF